MRSAYVIAGACVGGALPLACEAFALRPSAACLVGFLAACGWCVFVMISALRSAAAKEQP